MPHAHLAALLRLHGVKKWFSTLLDSYSDVMVEQAALAEKYGIAAIELRLGCFDLNGYVDIYDTRILQAIRDIRRVYRGKVLITEGTFECSGRTDVLPEDALRAVDMIDMGPGPVLPQGMRDSFAIDDLRRLCAEALTARIQRFSRFDTPFSLTSRLEQGEARDLPELVIACDKLGPGLQG